MFFVYEAMCEEADATIINENLCYPLYKTLDEVEEAINNYLNSNYNIHNYNDGEHITIFFILNTDTNEVKEHSVTCVKQFKIELN